MPKTKQVATKSSGKGKNVDLSSSSAPVPEIPKSSKKKALLAERGFNLENPSAEFLSTVAALGWQKFVIHRKEYIATLVHDFYQGIVERTDGEPSNISIVRGEEVKFSPRIINDYFGLGYYGKAIETKQKTYGVAEMQAVKERICVEGAVWERSGDHGNEFKILKKYLCDEANTWFHFIRHSLLPTSHTLWVDKERLIAIDAIMSRGKIEVGKLINREINKWRNRKDGYLYLPCLITDLCMDAGVEIEASELREKPSGPFSTEFKVRQRPGDATTSVDAQTLQRLVAQQNSMARFVKQQFEWQKKVYAHATKGKVVIEEPVLPDWMIELDAVEEEDDVPLSTIHQRAVKREKVKRARSPATKKKSPAKKKQKKVSSEEEELKSAELEDISEEDAEEARKVSLEVVSEDEEETHTEEKGSSSEKTDIVADTHYYSSDKTDIVADPPPTQKPAGPSKKPSASAKPKPSSPPPKQPQPSPRERPTQHQEIPHTPQSKPRDQPTPQPSPIQPEPEQEPQQQSSQQEIPSGDVVTSEATEVGSNPEQQPPALKLREKHVPTKSPFGKKKRSELATESQEGRSEEEKEEHLAEVEKAKRPKLQVKRKTEAPQGKPATVTSAVFATASQPEPVAVSEEEAVDVTTSAEKEAAQNLAELQAIKAHDDAVARAREQALEEATQRLAEHLLKQAQDKAAAIGDESTDVTTSKEPEVAKAPVDPQEPTQAEPEELAKQKAWEEAKKRIAESAAKITQEAGAPAAASSAAIGSEDTTTTTTTTTDVGGEKQKEKKKKKTAQASIPTRQSGRLRSGALNK